LTSSLYNLVEEHKRPTALAFDIASFLSFIGSTAYVNQIDYPTIPSKELALIEDYTLLALQGGETLNDVYPEKLKTRDKLSKAWFYTKRYGIPFVLGTFAATLFHNYNIDPNFNPSQGSIILLTVGLGLQWAKNEILHKVAY
jgi:hypothetical protein